MKGKPLTYSRYIDDIFLIWTGTKNELNQFFKDLSKKHPTIKFDYKVSKNCIVFLDTEIYLQNNKLHTKIHRIANDQQHYLRIKSKHPKLWKDPNQSSHPNQANKFKSSRFK